MSSVLSGETLGDMKNPNLQGWKSCTLSLSLKLLLSDCSWWTTGSEDYGGALSCGTQDAEHVHTEMAWCCSLALENDWIGNKWTATFLLNCWDNGEEKHYFFSQVGGHILHVIRKMIVEEVCLIHLSYIQWKVREVQYIQTKIEWSLIVSQR